MKAVEVSGWESDLDFFLPKGLHLEDLVGCSCSTTGAAAAASFFWFLLDDVGG